MKHKTKLQTTRENICKHLLQLADYCCHVIWFQFLREVIVVFIRHWIVIITVPLRFHVC